MDTYLPWIAIALGVLGVLGGSFGTKSSEETRSAESARLVPLILTALAMYGVVLLFPTALAGGLDFAHGSALGIAAVVMAGKFGSTTEGRYASALGAATAVAGVILLLPTEMRSSLWLGATVGAGASLLLGAGSTCRPAAWALGLFASSSVLGSFRDGVERAAAAPALIGALAIIVIFVMRLVPLPKMLKRVIAALSLVGAAALIAQRFLFLGSTLNIAIGSVLSAAIVAYILESNSPESPAPSVICSFIWLGWSTVAFGLMQGLGIALSAMFAGAFLIGCGSTSGLVSMSILIALSLYRIFLEAFPSDSKALDVSQHYAIMGIVAGAVLPMSIGTWNAQMKARFEGGAKIGAAFLTGLILVAVLVAAEFVLGSKGTVGILIGLCIAPLISGIGQGERVGIAAAVGALGAAVIVLFKFATPHLLIEREQKIQIVGWTVAAAIILIAIAAWMVREPGAKTVNEKPA